MAFNKAGRRVTYLDDKFNHFAEPLALEEIEYNLRGMYINCINYKAGN